MRWRWQSVKKVVVPKPEIDEEAVDQALRFCLDEADDGFVICSSSLFTMHDMPCFKSLMQDVRKLLFWYQCQVEVLSHEIAVRDHTIAALRTEIKDHIEGAEFASFQSVKDFAERCMKRFSIGSEARTVMMRELRNFM